MTKTDKLKTRFLSKPSDFKWDELKTLLCGLGYEEYNVVKTSLSRVRFIHQNHSDIMMHKPHPRPELKASQIR